MLILLHMLILFFSLVAYRDQSQHFSLALSPFGYNIYIAALGMYVFSFMLAFF